MKIVLGGPPHSGKSVLRERLKSQLLALAPNLYPYFLPTNPDGEGAWFQQAYQHNPQLATELKTSAKQHWNPERAQLYASWVRQCSQPLTFCDLGGIIDDYNRQICSAATHAIILAPTSVQLQPWREFFESCRLQILAELLSDYQAREDQILSLSSPFRATIHRLERGDLISPRPAVTALATFLLAQLPCHRASRREA
jgi:CRISPR-associated protein Csx3